MDRLFWGFFFLFLSFNLKFNGASLDLLPPRLDRLFERPPSLRRHAPFQAVDHRRAGDRLLLRHQRVDWFAGTGVSTAGAGGAAGAGGSMTTGGGSSSNEAIGIRFGGTM